MAIQQLPAPRWTVPGTSGGIAASWYVYTYQPGTSAAKATYTDYTGTVANSNPVVLDSRGEANIWWDGTYKVMVYTGDKDAGGALVWSQDNYGEGTTSVLQGNFNLVLNGSFETDTNGDGDPDDWTVTLYTGGASELDTTEQIHGAQALKFTSTGTGGGYATSDYFEVQGSKSLPVSFALLASAVDVHNQVDVIWYTAAKAVISTTTIHDDAAANPATWTNYSYTATAPATARYARLRLFGGKDDDATAGSVWFDDVVAEHPTMIGAYFPNVNANVTATDEELNIMDGVTASAAEINVLDGVSGITAAQINKLAELIIPGEVRAYAGSSAPTGWLLCYGQAVSRTTYADLFAVISTTYGTGNGSTTFNLPDMRGRVAVGLDNMGGSGANRITSAFADSLGGAGGAETHQLVISEMPSHTHTRGHGSSSTNTDVPYYYGATDAGHGYSATSSTGGDGYHNNLQPSIALNYIIKT